jgi:ATP-binding cassette subfamily F protein 3
LLLDEPTNHLDLEMRQALATAMQDFEGAMVVVSHDRHLLRLTCDQLLLVYNGRVEEFRDELDAYPAWLTAHIRSNRQETTQGGGTDSAGQRRERKRSEAERRKALQPLKRALDQCETRLQKLNARQAQLEEKLADTDLYVEPQKKELQALLRDKSAIDQELEEAEDAWIEAAEALEQTRA